MTQATDVDRAHEALERAAAGADAHNHTASDYAASPEAFRRLVEQSPLQVRSNLERVLMSDDPDEGLERLLQCGALDALMPEVKALVGFGDGEWRHKDVWKHTKQVVRQAVPRIEVRWAALLHDIGKVRTRSIGEGGEVHFFGHAELGARMFDRMDRRLKLFAQDHELRASIRFLILHHLRANQYESSWTDSAVRRFARELGGQLDNLLCLARADITTKRPEKKRRGLRQIEELGERIAQLAELDAVVPPLPSGVGNDIMQAFALPPSRLIGDIKRKLEEVIDQGEIESHQPSAYYVEYVGNNRDRFGF